MLTVYALGFVFHPYRVGAGGAWSSPFLAVPRVPQHRAYVVVDGVILPIHSEGLHTVTLTGRDAAGNTLPAAPAQVLRKALVGGLPPNPVQQASWENFDLVPDVASFMTPPALAAGWQNDLLFEMGFVGGELTAIPDRSTLDRKWHWPSGHEQAVSALTRYTVPDLAVGELTIDGRVAAALRSNSTVHVLNIVPGASDTAAARYARGLDHHVAILALGTPSPRVDLSNPLVNTPLSSWPGVSNNEFQQRVAPILATARAAPGSGGTGAVGIDPGYPSCSGRRMQLP